MDRKIKMDADALWYVGPGQAEIRREIVDDPRPGEVLVRTLYSAISRGTERLVFAGRVPESEHARMRAPFMEGAFPFPVKYGYATGGRIGGGPDELLGRTAFPPSPPQTAFALPADRITLLPPDLPASRAVLAANM